MSESSRELVARGLWTLRHDGVKVLVRKVATTVADRLDSSPYLPVAPELIADSRTLQLDLPTDRPSPGCQLNIGWVCTPPSLGSGGHTTMFRMIRALERAGHRCHLYLYDRHGGDIEAQRRVVRRGWPEIRAEIHRGAELSSQSDYNHLDACIATSWESAHVLATLGTAAMRRLYFVQDFEPYFYPRGSEYALAEDSYRFGFRMIALGQMVADSLTRAVGVTPDVTSFGCDTSVYHLDPGAPAREGVVWYARPGNSRRGYWLARLALQEFHRRHPESPVYVYGGDIGDVGFPVEVHPRLTPAELNQLYNRCVAGLALSFTNISLVAEELLAAGAIPVVNDSPDSRADLDNPYVAWAAPTPAGIAEALCRAVEDGCGHSPAAAASVRQDWSVAQRDVVRIIEDEVYGVRVDTAASSGSTGRF